MITLIHITVAALLLVLMFTIGNMIFSIGELRENNGENSKEDKKKDSEIYIVKIAMFMIVKIMVFGLLAQQIMFSFFDECVSLETHPIELLTFFIAFQIIFESVAINKTLRICVRSMNEHIGLKHKTLSEYFRNVSPAVYDYVAGGKTRLWVLSFGMNIMTILFCVYIMVAHNMNMFCQNIIAYFIILVYIKYMTIKSLRSLNK